MTADAERWVVVKTTAPRWCTLQIPHVIASMLGFGAETSPSERTIAFLDAGPGIAQVVPSAGVGATAPLRAGAAPAVATARPTKDLLFTLPCAVQRHLGLGLVRRGIRRAKGTDDLVAWAVPEEDWKPSGEPDGSDRRSAPRIFLVRSVFVAPAARRSESSGERG